MTQVHHCHVTSGTELINLVSAYDESREKQQVQEEVKPIVDDLNRREEESGFMRRWGRKEASYKTNPVWQVMHITMCTLVGSDLSRSVPWVGPALRYTCRPCECLS